MNLAYFIIAVLVVIVLILSLCNYILSQSCKKWAEVAQLWGRADEIKQLRLQMKDMRNAEEGGSPPPPPPPPPQPDVAFKKGG